MSEYHFSTKVLHTAYQTADAHGALHMPVYKNAAFEFESAEAHEDAFMGRRAKHSYSRISNPTVEHFEQKVRAITGGLSVTAVSSGMAAISTALLTVLQSGDELLTTNHLFGNTISLFEDTLKPWGITTSYCDFTDMDSVQAAITPATRIIFLETITNPQMEVADMKALTELANKHGIVVIADTTTTPPYLFSSKKHGVHIEIISSTKYMSGGATSVGGLIIDNGLFDWKRLDKLQASAKKFGPFAFTAKLKKEVFRNMGTCLSADSAYLQSLGLETLALRADKSCGNALELAEWLSEHEAVGTVNYPGLTDSPFYTIAKQQFDGRCGSVLTFELRSKKQCFAFINALKLIRRATNLHDNKTLIIHPASTIYCEYNVQKRAQMNVSDCLIRLAVGIEDCADLKSDMEAALELAKDIV